MPGKEAVSVHHKYPNNPWEEALGFPCCSQGLIKWWRRKPENLFLLWYMICVSQSKESYGPQGCHKITSLHPLLAPAKTRTHQSRRKTTTLDKLSLCKWRSPFFLVGVFSLHCPVNVSHPHKETALLFSWSPSQHIGCNSLLCFCSFVLNRWRAPLVFIRYNFCCPIWWGSGPCDPLPHWSLWLGSVPPTLHPMTDTNKECIYFLDF